MMNKKGFSLIELMVSMVVLALIMVGVVSMMINSDKAKRKTEMISEAQQQGAAALEMLLRDIRTAGYGVPMKNAQPIIAYATPFEIIFNANINPFPDSLGTLQPRDYDPAVNPMCPNYGVASQFGTGAETYRYTFDSDNSGAYAAADRADDIFETKTMNPNDVVLIRQTYGKMNDGTNNVYPVRNQNIALVLGPASAADTTVIPMFQYWYRGSGDSLRLWGDTNGDQQLNGNERLFTNPGATVISSIEMITITVTTETRNPVDRNQYRRMTVTTTTNLTNVPNTKAKYTLSGKFKIEGSGTGIDGGKVYISTGSMQTTDASGDYVFAVESGSHVITPEKLIDGSGTYYLLKNPQDTGVTVTNLNIANLDFRYVAISSSDMGASGGTVYNDTVNQGTFDTGERGIAGVQVSASGKPDAADSTTIGLTTTTDANGHYSFTLPAGTYAITEIDSPGYFSTTPNRVDTTIASGVSVTVNFGDTRLPAGTIRITVWKDVDKDSTRDSSEPFLPNVFCLISNANNGNLVASGRTDVNGVFSAMVPGDSLYTIYEVDPDSMISTAALVRTMGTTTWERSPEFNRVENLLVPADTTRELMFGDVVGFVAIALGQTERVLSLVTPDLREYRNPPDIGTTFNGFDNDIVLGTVNSTGLVSNLKVWYNRYQASTDPPASLFPSNYDEQFNLTHDITALSTDNLDQPSMGGNPLSLTNDVICGLKENTGGYNISVGLTNDGGGSGVNTNRYKGRLRYSVRTYATITDVSQTTVSALACGRLTNSGEVDFVVGTIDDDQGNIGHLEIWRNVTGDTLGNFTRDTVMYDAGGGVSIGGVRSIYLMDVVDSTGNFGSDLPNFYQDLIVGTKTGSFPNYSGQLLIFRRKGYNRRFELHACYPIPNAYINGVTAYQSGKAANNRRDIACALRTIGSAEDDYDGRVDLWHNHDNGTFGSYDAVNSLWVPTQSVGVEGEVTCLATGQLNADNINDIVIGIKIAENLGGTKLFQNFAGEINILYQDLFGGVYTGEVVTVNTAVLRSVPGKTDVVVGERYEEGGVGYGRVILYFGQ
jgi:prepilin-type N-terminal cleavage/methylation domain-containing protein